VPERETIERARRDKREGKAPSTQAGEFVREEIEHIRELLPHVGSDTKGTRGTKGTRRINKVRVEISTLN
jgi:hypothetical protein